MLIDDHVKFLKYVSKYFTKISRALFLITLVNEFINDHCFGSIFAKKKQSLINEGKTNGSFKNKLPTGLFRLPRVVNDGSCKHNYS